MTSPGSYLFPLLLLSLLTLPLNQMSDSFDDALQPELQDEPQPDLDPYIIDGTLVRRGKYPFVVSLETSGHYCGGTILNEDSILTAAHCLKKDPKSVKVYIGNVNINSRSVKGRFIFRAKRFIVNSKYTKGKSSLGYDVGIIKLTKKINFDKLGATVGKTCLPQGPQDRPDRAHNCIVIGWGRNQVNARQKLLHEAPFRLQSVRTCRRKGFSWYNAKKIYCALGGQGRGRSCRGDSGGPVICRPKTGASRWIQYGIVSFGAPNCSARPSFFTAVDKFTRWIKRHI